MSTAFDIGSSLRKWRAHVRKPVLAGALLIVALLLTACPWKMLGFQGRLLDENGNPLNGQFDFVFKYWTCSAGTGQGCDVAYEYAVNDVQVTNGLFDVPIGENTFQADEGIDPAIFARSLYLEVTVEGETLSPRQPVLGAPFAMGLVGGAVVLSIHEGPGGDDGTDANYGTLSVVAAGAKGTALVVKANVNGGDLIRGCVGPLGGTNQRDCNSLVFRVENDGDVRADGGFTSPAADFAEMIAADGERDAYEPGDVLVISDSRDRAVALSTTPNSTAVIGVYSTKPAFLGGVTSLDGAAGDEQIPVGIVGIVPVKVSAENGPIHRGDLLTTSSTPGHAMKATEYIPGSILGKAMGELDEGTGVIEVVLLLQ